ncbi:hypothetical protein GJAV_G00170610 [Gymnothorax javanicus]|nr:hypothetical protein GJAV_G00170610 [Gymnothorax javanicus]
MVHCPKLAYDLHGRIMYPHHEIQHQKVAKNLNKTERKQVLDVFGCNEQSSVLAPGKKAAPLPASQCNFTVFSKADLEVKLLNQIIVLLHSPTALEL